MAHTPKAQSATGTNAASSSRARARSSEISRGKQNKSASKQSAADKKKSKPGEVATGSKTQNKTLTTRPKTRRKTTDKIPAASGATTCPQPTASNAAANTAKETGPNGYPLFSLSQLSDHCDIDRSVARRRLKAAKIKPVLNQEKKKLFELTPEVEELLHESGDPQLEDSKRRIAAVNAAMKEMELDEAQKRLVPYEEAQEEWQEILKWLYQLLVIENPRRNAAGYRKNCKTTGELIAALKRDSAKPFQDLRANYSRIFKQRGGKQ
jgi:hypothetical protein